MKARTLIAITFALVSSANFLHAQNNNQTPGQQNPTQQTPAANDKIGDSPEPTHFWQASVAGGNYMVALDRITAISRHKYLLSGGLIVDEVTVDTVGQSLARFYFVSPVTDAASGNSAGSEAARIVDRGRELVDKAASRLGTDAPYMVHKDYPTTTHAHTVEYLLQSNQELTALYNSVRTAWESGKGRRFTIKN